MCQVNGPAIRVACGRCGASVEERWAHRHECLQYVPFEEWDADLQRRASAPYDKTSKLITTMHNATVAVANMALWQRRYAWAEQYRHSVRAPWQR